MDTAQSETPNPGPICPDCRVEMEKGWQPDAGHHVIAQALWHPGEPRLNLFNGYHVSGKAIPMTLWRCPHCGLIRQYAIKVVKNWRKVD